MKQVDNKSQMSKACKSNLLKERRFNILDSRGRLQKLATKGIRNSPPLRAKAQKACRAGECICGSPQATPGFSCQPGHIHCLRQAGEPGAWCGVGWVCRPYSQIPAVCPRGTCGTLHTSGTRAEAGPCLEGPEHDCVGGMLQQAETLSWKPE